MPVHPCGYCWAHTARQSWQSRNGKRIKKIYRLIDVARSASTLRHGRATGAACCKAAKPFPKRRGFVQSYDRFFLPPLCSPGCFSQSPALPPPRRDFSKPKKNPFIYLFSYLFLRASPAVEPHWFYLLRPEGFSSPLHAPSAGAAAALGTWAGIVARRPLAAVSRRRRCRPGPGASH